jgi:hypothetical protein
MAKKLRRSQADEYEAYRNLAPDQRAEIRAELERCWRDMPCTDPNRITKRQVILPPGEKSVLTACPPGRCSCGTELAIIDLEKRELRCSECGEKRGRVSQATNDFITKFSELFGTTVTPIMIRRGGL